MVADFESTDSVRSGKPLRHVQTAVFPTPMELHLGELSFRDAAIRSHADLFAFNDVALGQPIVLCM